MMYTSILQPIPYHNFTSSLAYKLLHKHRILSKGHRKDLYPTTNLPYSIYIKNIPLSYYELVPSQEKRPTFTQRLRSRVIQESQPVKLSCLIDFTQNIQVSWFKGRTEITIGDPHIDIRCNHGICTLEISSCALTDMAEYTCKVENQHGFDETSAFLCVERRSKKPKSTTIDFDTKIDKQAEYRHEVKEPEVKVKKRKTVTFAPHILEHIQGVTVYEGAAIMLQCRIDGKPLPTVEWTHNGKKLLNGGKIEIQDDPDCPTLIIRDISKVEEGEYSCIVTNSVGSNTSIADVVVKALLKKVDDQADEVKDQIEHLDEIVDERVSPISEPMSVTTDSVEDELERDKENKILHVKRHLQGQLLKEGQALHLVCEIAGDIYGDIGVQWTRNGKVIPDNPDFDQEQDGLKFTLHVAEMYPEDSGDFGICVSCDNQICESVCSIVVQDPTTIYDPIITEFPQAATSSLGEMVELTCTGGGSKPLSAIWYFNDEEIENSKKYSLSSNDDNQFKLKIKDLRLTDRGSYRIEISNSLGEISALTFLQVMSS